MDPFYEVLHDAQQQSNALNEFLQKIKQDIITEETKSDFHNSSQELNETIQDLNESIDSSKSDPEFFKVTPDEIQKREEILNELKSKYNVIFDQWNTKLGNSNSHKQAFARYDEEVTDTDQPTAEQINSMNEFQQQQIINEQDQHLDGVYQSMQTINQQARAMGNELEEQAYILDDLDADLDRVGSKLGRGLKRVEHVIRRNQERVSDCCIGLLIVALIVLLVLVIIV